MYVAWLIHIYVCDMIHVTWVLKVSITTSPFSLLCSLHTCIEPIQRFKGLQSRSNAVCVCNLCFEFQARAGLRTRALAVSQYQHDTSTAISRALKHRCFAQESFP